MTKLSVNVNKIATLRNARGKNLPDVVQMGRDILAFGAHGLTVHPRPDGRHIRTEDVIALSAVVREFNSTQTRQVEFNVEGYPSQNYLDLIKEVRPDQATLVPDPPEALTSNAGWRVAANAKFLGAVIADLQTLGVRTSIFVDPFEMSEADYQALTEVKTDRIELYTEAFAEEFHTNERALVLRAYVDCARRAAGLGIKVNAGHDLNQVNLGTLVQAIPDLAEVSIGHALISEALYEGMKATVANYLRILKWPTP